MFKKDRKDQYLHEVSQNSFFVTNENMGLCLYIRLNIFLKNTTPRLNHIMSMVLIFMIVVDVQETTPYNQNLRDNLISSANISPKSKILFNLLRAEVHDRDLPLTTVRTRHTSIDVKGECKTGTTSLCLSLFAVVGS